MRIMGNTVLPADLSGDIGRDLADRGKHAFRTMRRPVISHLKLSVQRRVCACLLWRLERYRPSLARRMGNLADEQLQALGVRRSDIEALLAAALAALAQAAAERSPGCAEGCREKERH